MPTPSEKLAESLALLKAIQDRGQVAFRANELTRTHRERLHRNGFIREVMKGWFVPTRPDEPAGESTSWFASFWTFCATYLDQRFGAEWCLGPEQSISLHTGNRSVPRQLLVRAPKAGNKPTNLLFDTSIFDLRLKLPPPQDIELSDGLRVFTLPAALIDCPPANFRARPVEMRAALAMITDATDLLRRLLEGGRSTIAGRLAGALRSVGRDLVADDIVRTMRAAGYVVTETNPFEDMPLVRLAADETSPQVNRLRMNWAQMRLEVLRIFPAPPGLPRNLSRYLGQVDEAYISDAYNSLSIEGYKVNTELIERVRSGQWNPDDDRRDQDQRDALAARGYWQSFQSVRESIRRALRREDPGLVAASDHGAWYRELFAPSVAAGLVRPSDLAGYRNGPVHIRRSMHTP
ncbi:MAG: cell filamentation protein Fic, partial [Gammaproteobacteria bacterium]|nr:cell filamentation protein Fic [Gammaproteobacteria bacterium]